MSFSPPSAFVRGWLVRGLLLWVAIHLGAAFVEIFLFDPLQLGFVLLLVFAAAAGDDVSRRDDVLLGNLGVAPMWGGAVSAVAVLVLELAVQTAWVLA